jgi:Leucine-rich repeat (LRR) protein
VTNRDKKDSIRGRMADAGEPFSVARRKAGAAAHPVSEAEFQEIRRTGRGNLANRELTALPPEMTQLTSLRELWLGGNQLTALPPEIGQLTSLRTLGLGGNQLTALPAEIGQLTNLHRLELGGNQLSALPREVANLLSSVGELGLAGNPLPEPIFELYGQGPQAFASYLRDLG